MALVTALETTLDKAAANADAGPPDVPAPQPRRVRGRGAGALFGIDVDVAAYLPADTISASFDNIADVQMPSATVMQGYMRAAAYVSRAVVGDPADRRELDDVRSAADAVAEGSRRRRALRHARRHRRHAQLPRRRQLQVPAAAARRADRRCSSAGRSAQDSDGSGDRRRARARSSRSIAGSRNPIPRASRSHGRTDSREGRPAPHRRDVRPRVRGRGRRSHQADRSHARRHADRRRLRRDDAAAPAQPRDRGTVQGDGRVGQPGAAEECSRAVPRSRKTPSRARSRSSSAWRPKRIAGPRPRRTSPS